MKKNIFLFSILSLSIPGNTASASTLTYWTANLYNAPGGYYPTKHTDHISACKHLIGTPPESWWWNAKIVKKSSNQYACYRDYTALFCPSCGDELRGYATLVSITCPYGHQGFECNITPPTCDYGTFDSRSNQCVAGADKGQPPSACSQSSANDPSQLAGNPINFLTGNKFHQEVYFTAVDAGGLSFLQTYNSADAVWRHSYSDKLVFSADHISVVLSDGKELRYSLNGSALDSAAARFGLLTTSNNGWTFATKDQRSYSFDPQGRLVRLTLANGLSHQLSYAVSGSNTHVSVTDAFGKNLLIKRNPSGQLIGFESPGISLAIYYLYGNISKIAKTVNGQQVTREYHYEDSRNILLLTGITDERGLRYATWRYDDQGRAISSEHHAGLDKVQISYDSNLSTTVTNELGKKVTYRFAVIDGSKRITAIEGHPSTNCPASDSSFTYDNLGLLVTKTDNKGVLTTYSYNERGLEISRTEAAGTPAAHTITTEWHPDFFLPLTVTEPTRVVRYQYNSQGQLLSRTVEAL